MEINDDGTVFAVEAEKFSSLSISKSSKQASSSTGKKKRLTREFGVPEVPVQKRQAVEQ